MNKTALRRFYKKLRNAIPRAEQVSKSTRIGMSLYDNIDWSKVRHVHVYSYQPRLSEVDTEWLISELPKLQPFVEVTKGDNHKGALIPKGTFDVIVVPLLAFDESCHRIGYGGGWYDRFLATQPDAIKVGVAFDVQLAESFPIEDHDVQLDMVITESSVFTK